VATPHARHRWDSGIGAASQKSAMTMRTFLNGGGGIALAAVALLRARATPAGVGPQVVRLGAEPYGVGTLHFFDGRWHD
jgi:hypothetical protein